MIWVNAEFQLVGILIWVVVFFVAVIVESLEPQLVSMWFAGGALIALIMATFFRIGIGWQILIFTVSSVVLLVLTKPFVKKVMKKNITPTNADALIGQEILVEKGFSQKQAGMGIHGDIHWKLITEEDTVFSKGEFAIVKKITGNKLTVIKRK